MQTLSHNLEQKKKLLQTQQKNAEIWTQKVDLSIHGVQLCFHLQSEELVCELYDLYPLAWFERKQGETLDIFWTNSRSLNWADKDWENEPNPECFIFEELGCQLAVQRDFAATLSENRCHLICPYDLADGFYNFLRWLLPLRLIRQGHMLLHSSCILDDQDQAYFCLGPSGAGKSTISSFRPRKKILGDDMNILKIENDQCWAQAGALGQAILNPKEYSNWYPVRALFWLNKAETVEIHSLSRATQLFYLNTSVANVFWDRLPQPLLQNIFKAASVVLEKTPLYQLSFPKKERVWDMIFESLNATERKNCGQ